MHRSKVLSNSRWFKRISVIFATVGIAGTLAFWYFANRLPPIPRRPLRIGFEVNPPFQIRAGSGFSGLAIETLDEAAKRVGVRLQWVETGTSSEESFQKGLVDLWPLMVDLPERRRHVHFSRPWLYASHVLLLRAGAAIPARDFAGRIALFKLPLHARMLQARFPNAQTVQFPDGRRVLKEVCSGAAAAGFLEGRVAMISLKEVPPECASSIRVQPIAALTVSTSVASTFEAAGAAELLRREIDNQFRDGTLAATLAKYSYYGLDDSWTTYQLLEAAKRAHWIAWGTGGLAVALTVALWQTLALRQRKRVERALLESEECFRLIFQQAGVGVAQISLEGRLELANAKYCEVVGHAREDLLGKGTLDITHSEDLKAQTAMLPRLLAGEIQSFSTEKRYTRKDGAIVWAKVCKSLVRNGYGQPKGFIAVVEDITERKLAESALRESEERFRRMADSAPVLLWVSGTDKRRTFFNQQWLNFTGRTMEQELGDGWAAGVHPEDLDRCLAVYSSAFDAHRGFQKEYRLRRADGAYRWILGIGIPRFEPGGIFAGYIGSCIDITDLKCAQEKAFERQKLESLGVLTSGIAHDFNNLLGGILASAELALAEHAEGSSLDKEELLRIRTAAIRGGEVVRELMTYAGEESRSFESVDVSRLVNEMLELLKVSISKRAMLKVNLAEKLPTIRANAAQIRQVVMSLITNASEALGEEEGVISFTVAQVRSGPDSTAPDRLQGGFLRLEVSDTGCGMTEEIQAKIFDPFFTTRIAGRGLGLAAVLGIVRSHGGAINVVSAPGRGSRFEILLPCSSESAVDSRDMAIPAAASETRRCAGTILVVEDEDTLRLAVSKMLRRKGFIVIEVANGKTAIDLFRAHAVEIDVVLLDLTLPGMSSREVLGEFRKMRPDVNVIITTAYSRDHAFAVMGGEQSWLYIQKPYQLSDLADLLRKASSPKSQSDRAAG
jgi:PAS domain S-box-containing protein